MAAQGTARYYSGAAQLPVRVFLNPDLDILLTTNTNAGTTLRQIAFDKSIQAHLGSVLFMERVDRYRKDRGLVDDNESDRRQAVRRPIRPGYRNLTSREQAPERERLQRLISGRTGSPERKSCIAGFDS